jgi:hypothetical protein
MADDQLDGRKIVIPPGSADGLRGPARSIALTAEAKALADAVVGALGRIDIFDDNGRIVFLAQGRLHPVNGVVLREIIRANFATKHLVTTGTGLSVEYRPVEVSELVIRMLLTAAPQDGGLIGRVPLAMPEPREMAAVPEAEPPQVPSNPIEDAAGKAALAKHAGAGGERTRGEIEQGQRRLAQLRNG